MNKDALEHARFMRLWGLTVVYADMNGIRLKCNGPVSFMRDEESQGRLYQIGRRGIADEKTVTDCDGKVRKSLHQSGRAMDVSVIDTEGNTIYDEEPYRKVAAFWKSLGGRWGGDFQPTREIWHFDLMTGRE